MSLATVNLGLPFQPSLRQEAVVITACTAEVLHVSIFVGGRIVTVRDAQALIPGSWEGVKHT